MMADSKVSRLCNGHSSEVLCVCVKKLQPVQIISGGESGELAIWSLDGKIIFKGKISDDDILSIVCSKLNPQQMFVSSGRNIHEFDLRQLKKPVDVCLSSDEEINQLAMNGKEDLMAVADDSGNVKVINMSNRKLLKTLKKHSNICSSVSFVSSKPWDLFSGSYDCSLIQWNITKSRSKSIINMNNVNDDAGEVESFRVSPPFIHCLKVAEDGSKLVCGTENALVHVFDISKGTVVFERSLRGHVQGVSQLLIETLPSAGEYIISSGNDNRICLWDVASKSAESENLTALKRRARVSSREEKSEIHLKHTIVHSSKINCIDACIDLNDNFLIVADNTASPAVLRLPH